jgi:hypothetical protein
MPENKLELMNSLNTKWKQQHFEYLCTTLTEQKEEIADAFKVLYVDIKRQIFAVEEKELFKIYYVPTLLSLLADYYLDEREGYQCAFGDFIYYAFTDLLPSELDIFTDTENFKQAS